MKQVFFLAALLSLACPFAGCKTKKQTGSSTSETATTSSNTQVEKYRVIISFISKGTGTDGEKRQAIMSYIEKHPKKPTNSIVHWGREGETDFCLNLTELSKSEQTEFVSEIKKLAAGSDLIFISENAEKQHQGR